MKVLIAGIGILTSIAVTANAQSIGLTGEYEFSLEGGFAMPLNSSERALIVENNVGSGPWDVTPLVDADILDFGVIPSFAAEFSARLNSGGSIFLRAQSILGQGETDLTGLWIDSGAIPGTHDDGYLIRSEWNPSATVTTQERAIAAGYRSADTTGFTWMAGLSYASVSQDLDVVFNVTDDETVYVSGAGTNIMYGAIAGVGYTRPLSDKWSFALDSDLSVLHNRYDYNYDYLNDFYGTVEHVGADGESTALRLNVAGKLAYHYSQSTTLSGIVGVTNYWGVVSGMDTMLNEENTRDTVTPVTSSITLPYIRFGVSVAF